jgi:hypothetical protein
MACTKVSLTPRVRHLLSACLLDWIMIARPSLVRLEVRLLKHQEQG